MKNIEDLSQNTADLDEIHRFNEIHENILGNPKIYKDFQEDLPGFIKDFREKFCK